MTGIESNWNEVKQRLEFAAQKTSRNLQDIAVVAVTKNVEVDRIKKLNELGLRMLGENRVQEMLDKMPQLSEDIQWHMIGHLQRNKVKYIVGKVCLIHSLDRWSLALEIQRQAEKKDTIVPVLVQVNLHGEDTKHGLSRIEIFDFISEISKLKRIEVKGLMTMAPYVHNPEEVRPVFREVFHLARNIKQRYSSVSMDYLSMGMSNDFEVAIEEGANMVRIGSALFGPRL